MGQGDHEETIPMSGHPAADPCCKGTTACNSSDGDPSDALRPTGRLSGSEVSTCELRIGGMDCPSCAAEITRSLAGLEGVRDVRVDVLGGKVTVSYAGGKVARGDLAGAIRRVGYRVEDGDARRGAFTVEGMDCADEVRQIEDTLGRLPGVTDLRFDLMRHRLVVEGAIASSEVLRAIRGIGMTARAEGEQARPPGSWEGRGRLVLTVASGALLGLAMALGWLGF